MKQEKKQSKKSKKWKKADMEKRYNKKEKDIENRVKIERISKNNSKKYGRKQDDKAIEKRAKTSLRSGRPSKLIRADSSPPQLF